MVAEVVLFFPMGLPREGCEEVVLGVDELEAIRLADLFGLYHEEAAQQMGVSRATFGRILESARRKVAEALVLGKGIRVEGGDVEFVERPGFGHCHRWGQKGGGRMARCSGRAGMGPGGLRLPELWVQEAARGRRALCPREVSELRYTPGKGGVSPSQGAPSKRAQGQRITFLLFKTF